MLDHVTTWLRAEDFGDLVAKSIAADATIAAMQGKDGSSRVVT